MFRKTLLVSIVCGLMLLLAQPKSLLAAKPSLAGSWELTLTPNTPPTPPAIEFPGLATFTTDGSMVETDGTELAPTVSATGAPAFGTPGHGIWQLGPCLCNFYIQYISLGVNANGTLNSKSVTVATVTTATTTSGPTFTGQYTTTTTGPAGTPPKTTTGAITGQLIPHPLLP